MEALLSPKNVAGAIGVSESSLKRWADEGMIRFSRTAGGHRRILLTEAIRFIRVNHHAVVRPDLLGLNEVGQLLARQPALRQSDPQTSLFEALQDGDGMRARGLITAWFLDGRDLSTLLDGPIRAVMAQLGEIWQHSDEGIFVEHRATDLCVQALNHVRTLLPAPAADAPVATGGAPSGDPYILPTLMASMVLAELGYRTVNLGGDTPLDVLGRAAVKCKAQLVWVSFTSPQPPKILRQQIEDLAGLVQPVGSQVVVGGQQMLGDLRLDVPHVHIVRSMHDLVMFGSGLINRSPRPQTSSTR